MRIDRYHGKTWAHTPPPLADLIASAWRFMVAKEGRKRRACEIGMRFKGLAGRIDQGTGIVFDLEPNGDDLILRANRLENNLKLLKYERGKRNPAKWIRNVPTPSKRWHDLKLEVRDKQVKGYLDGKLYLDLGLSVRHVRLSGVGKS